ncbi:universal stress protein [Actinomadura atramentaria]|uniref:universal stress protein n=1 Tax=Actinomadura atramentaria TaxID=1990 RepID=UPI000364272F|nr:universal stress protein [Actinomadura atramentaria]
MIGDNILVGYDPGPGGREAVDLAFAFVRVTGGLVTVAHVHAPGRPAAAAEAANVLANVRRTLDDPATDVVAQESRSVGRGLAAAAGRAGADCILIGSAEGGPRGRITVGSTADHLLHSSPEAVILTPSGLRPTPKLSRITVMYVDRPQCEDAVLRGAVAAQSFGVPLRLLTLALEEDPQDRLRDDLALAVRIALDSSGLDPEDVRTELAHGDDVAAAMDAAEWVEDEVVIVASGENASPHRVFLGEIALKVVRAATCPVIVLPRGYT